MNRRKQYCINSIKALITAIAIILTSALSCVPACADTNDNSERIFYQFEEDLGEYAYADYTNSRYFILRGEQIAVYDAESDFYNIFYDFKQKSPDPDTFQFYDFYALGSKLYYLYQSGGASYVIIIDFNKLSIFKNKFTFPCTSVMATSSGDVLVYTTSYNGLVFMIKSDGSSSNSKMTTPIEKFYGEDSDGNIYFAQSNGVTFAKYDGKTFTPSNRRLTDVKPDLTKHVTPVEIFNKNMIADYSGNVFSLKNGATSSLFSFGRENYSKINYQGYGTLTVPITGTNYVIGMGENSSVELYDFSKKKFISSIVTRHNLYSIVRFGTGVICFEKDDTGNYVEIIPLSDFMDLSVTEVNLNNQNVYKGRTSVDAVKKYSSAISEFDLSASMLSDNGSSKAPYVKSEMTDDAQQALLNFSNYQRWLAGLSGYTTGSDTVKDIAAKGSILLEASPIQGHYPPKPDDMDDAFYDIAYKQRREIDTHNGVNQVKPVGALGSKRAGEQRYNLVDNPVQHKGSHGGEKAHKQGEDNHKHPLAHVLHAPVVQPLQPLRSSICYCRFHLYLSWHGLTRLSFRETLPFAQPAVSFYKKAVLIRA